ncbi:hypothetical protein CgunFtcFv8_000091 [Champsocephalus gunnari]|uniref:Uncharacterized protein n=1 Tax=Champsocephalus gunnari TaxID=52237 RepID=A0AAN8DLC1_CHAGU|nr:hypothetical protein CgunFtcFv8_000091 [Champsocephalus gunnari]
MPRSHTVGLLRAPAERECATCTLCPSARLPARPPPAGSARTHPEPERADSGRSLRPQIITTSNVHPRSSALQVRRAVMETDNATDPQQHTAGKREAARTMHCPARWMDGGRDGWICIMGSTQARRRAHL